MTTEQPGVYLITHMETGRVYVGSTSNISKRWSRHRAELRDGKHRNAHLQSAWNKHGQEAFSWRLVAIVEPDHRIELEQRLIDHFQATDPDRGFNRAAIAGVSYGGTRAVWTPERRERASLSNSAAKAPLRLQVGDRCTNGHIIDGTYVRRRKGRTGRIHESLRCQDCERKSAYERARRKYGIPLDHPRGQHYNRRQAG